MSAYLHPDTLDSIAEDVQFDKQEERIAYVQCVTGHDVDEREVLEYKGGFICEQCATNTWGESL